MKFRKVVYFRYLPLTVKIHSDFYMEQVIKVGIVVEYWDLSLLFFNNSIELEDSSELLENVVKFRNYDQLENEIAIQDLKKTLFISIVTYEGRVLRLFKMLIKYNCTLGVFGRNMFPTVAARKLNLLELFPKLNIRSVKNFWNNRQTLRLISNSGKRPYDIIFQGGAQGWKGVGCISQLDANNATVVNVNSDDYDRYLMLQDSTRIIEGDYILFLDEYLPLHPDTELFKIKNVSSENYYPLLNDYFDKVERQFGLPVVIAAHPKAIKYRDTDYFKGRRVFFGKSAELSRDACFVLAHDSTSINYPIAFGKRLHFITSKAIEQSINSVHKNVVSFSSYLGCNWQYMDNAQHINVVDNISEKEYQQYKFEFMCSLKTVNKLTNQIFIEYLCE